MDGDLNGMASKHLEIVEADKTGETRDTISFLLSLFGVREIFRGKASVLISNHLEPLNCRSARRLRRDSNRWDDLSPANPVALGLYVDQLTGLTCRRSHPAG